MDGFFAKKGIALSARGPPTQFKDNLIKGSTQPIPFIVQTPQHHHAPQQLWGGHPPHSSSNLSEYSTGSITNLAYYDHVTT